MGARGPRRPASKPLRGARRRRGRQPEPSAILRDEARQRAAARRPAVLESDATVDSGRAPPACQRAPRTGKVRPHDGARSDARRAEGPRDPHAGAPRRPRARARLAQHRQPRPGVRRPRGGTQPAARHRRERRHGRHARGPARPRRRHRDRGRELDRRGLRGPPAGPGRDGRRARLRHDRTLPRSRRDPRRRAHRRRRHCAHARAAHRGSRRGAAGARRPGGGAGARRLSAAAHRGRRPAGRARPHRRAALEPVRVGDPARGAVRGARRGARVRGGRRRLASVHRAHGRGDAGLRRRDRPRERRRAGARTSLCGARLRRRARRPVRGLPPRRRRDRRGPGARPGHSPRVAPDRPPRARGARADGLPGRAHARGHRALRALRQGCARSTST